jgi:hypothetical protein
MADIKGVVTVVDEKLEGKFVLKLLLLARKTQSWLSHIGYVCGAGRSH